MNPGKIILLNGITCAEKTNICTALQAVWDEPSLCLSLEQLLDLIPNPKQALPVGADHLASTPQANALGGNALYACDPRRQQVISGMHRMIAALASIGNQVIVDHFLFEPHWLCECAQLFCELPTFFVGVRCAPAKQGQHEWESGSCTFDPAQAQLAAVHTPGVYDLELDPARFSPQECALQIKRRVLAGPPPLAMRWLKAWLDPTKQRGWLRQNEQYNLHITTGTWA